MRKKLFALLSFSLMLAVISPIATAAPKPGTSCTKIGATATSAGIKYTCIKSGKKLIWNKGVAIKVPTPVSSVSPTPSSSPSPSVSPTSTPTPTPTVTPTQTKSPDEINGQPCTKENERIRNSIDEFWCWKDPNGTLRWTENYRFRAPNPRPILSPIKYEVNQYFAPMMPSAPIQNCKIQENSNQGSKRGDLSSGFPYMPRFQSYPTKYKMALIPIDFADLEGDKDFRSRVDSQMQTLSDWYKDVSGGRFTVEWVVSNEWIRLPGLSKDYYVEYSGKYPDTEEFWRKVIPVVDSKFDLTGVQTINFLLPPKQQLIYESVQGFSYTSETKKYNSAKTKIYSFATAGTVFEAPDTALWEYWAHEFGHEIGLAHVGASRGEVEPIMQMELLGDHDGPYRELGGWLRFIIGWLSDSQVYCQETNGLTTNEISLVPLNEPKDGIKTVVIPTGVDSAIVIDSRRPNKYGCPVPNLPGGVLVYTYDAKLGNQSYFIKAHYPEGRQPTIRCEVRTTYPDILLHTGDSVKVGAYTITVTSSGTFDQIRITKN